MFFRYPIDAVADNWLHDCLAEMIDSVKAAVSGNATPLAWPDIIPSARRIELEPRYGLRDRWKIFVEKVVALPKVEALDVLATFENQNAIATLLDGTTTCKRTRDLPETVQAAVKDLFTFAYELVRNGDVRARAYEVIDKKRPQRMCPFCGYEPMSAVNLPKDALDHYLCKEHYPFAAANLRNLAPIGHKCNSSYKLAKDVILRDDGTPRRAFDPFTCDPVQVKEVLDQFDPASREATWAVQFDQNSEEVDTWNDVFSIKSRFEAEVLSEYEQWLRWFGDWARQECARTGTTDPKQLLVSYATTWARDDYSGRGFVRRPFFDRMIELYESTPSVKKYVENLVEFSLPSPA